MRWTRWRAGVLAGLMLAVTTMSQTTTPPSSPPKLSPPAVQPTPASQLPAQQAPPATTPPPTAQPSTAPVSPPPATTGQTTLPPDAQAPPRPAATPARVAIMLDAAHGGDERGAALTDKLEEKDVVLSIARRVRGELARAGVPVTMLRDADVTLDSDQRAQMANASRPLLYVALHASSAGTGVRIYTAILPEVQPAPGTLVRWQRAQQDWLDASHVAAESLAADLGDHELAASTLAAPVPPLNNVLSAAIAVEIAPPPGGRATADMLGSSQYQQRVASALAAALVNARKKIGAPQ